MAHTQCGSHTQRTADSAWLTHSHIPWPRRAGVSQVSDLRSHSCHGSTPWAAHAAWQDPHCPPRPPCSALRLHSLGGSSSLISCSAIVLFLNSWLCAFNIFTPVNLSLQIVTNRVAQVPAPPLIRESRRRGWGGGDGGRGAKGWKDPSVLGFTQLLTLPGQLGVQPTPHTQPAVTNTLHTVGFAMGIREQIAMSGGWKAQSQPAPPAHLPWIWPRVWGGLRFYVKVHRRWHSHSSDLKATQALEFKSSDDKIGNESIPRVTAIFYVD